MTFVCEKCKKEFKYNSILKQHMNRKNPCVELNNSEISNTNTQTKNKIKNNKQVYDKTKNSFEDAIKRITERRKIRNANKKNNYTNIDSEADELRDQTIMPNEFFNGMKEFSNKDNFVNTDKSTVNNINITISIDDIGSLKYITEKEWIRIITMAMNQNTNKFD